MSESYVDLTYRGLSLAKRVKLFQVRPSTGYVEHPAPMPVGTTIGIITEDDGLILEATVAEIHEQIAGSEKPAGMVVSPKLDASTAKTWWTARVVMPDEVKVQPAPAVGIVVSKRKMEGAVPDLIDDGRNTAVMEAIDPTSSGELPASDTTDPLIVDDGKRTTAMAVVDLEALGLDPLAQSGPIPIVTGEDDGGDKSGGNRKKRKKR